MWIGSPLASNGPRASRRRGFALALAICCVGLLALILSAVLSINVRGRQVASAQLKQMQAAWLVEAGAERAADRLAVDPSYVGEELQLGSHDLPVGQSARIRIEVKADGMAPEQRKVAIVAEFPADGPRRARLSKIVVINRAGLADPKEK